MEGKRGKERDHRGRRGAPARPRPFLSVCTVWARARGLGRGPGGGAGAEDQSPAQRMPVMGEAERVSVCLGVWGRGGGGQAVVYRVKKQKILFFFSLVNPTPRI